MSDNHKGDEYANILASGGQLPRQRPAAPSDASTNRSTGKKRTTPGRRTPTANRFHVLNAFADHWACTVSSTAQAVWWQLFREVKPNGIAIISQGRLATKIGMSVRTVVRALDDLKAAKLITMVRKGGPNAGPAGYRVHGVPGGSAESQRQA